MTLFTHILLFPPHRSLLQWTLWPGSGGTTPVTHLTIMFVKEIDELHSFFLEKCSVKNCVRLNFAVECDLSDKHNREREIAE